MLRLSRSSLGPFALAFAVSAVAMLLVSPPDEASAKGFRFSFSKSKSDGPSHTDSGTARHRDHGEEDAAPDSGSDGPMFSVRPKVKGAAPDEDDEDKSPSDSAEMNDEPTGKPASETADEKSSPAAEPATTAQDKSAEEPAPAASRATASRREPKPVKQHPLAAAHPGMDVVVCEGGCTNSKEIPEAVYVQATTASASIAEVKPTSSQAAAHDPMKDMIVCMGGCYDTPKFYRSPMATADVTSAAWTATVVPMNAKPAASGSGSWMRRIDAERGEPAPGYHNIQVPRMPR